MLDAVLYDTRHGRATWVLSGAAVTEALSQIDIPGHETYVEVGKRAGREGAQC